MNAKNKLKINERFCIDRTDDHLLKHPGGDVEEASVAGGVVLVHADLVAHDGAEWDPHLLGHAGRDRDGGDTSGLGHDDVNRPAPMGRVVEDELRDLGRLAAAGVPRNDGDL